MMIFEYAMIAAAAFAGALVSGLGGTGGTFIIVIVLTPLVGPKAVIPLIAVYAICSNLSRVYFYWRSIAWKTAIQFTVASLPGIFLGASFLREIPETFFLGFLGATLALMLPVRRYIKRVSFQPGIKTIGSLGFAFGFMSGTAPGSGILVVAFFNSIGLSGPLLLGTDAIIGLANALSRSGTFYSMDLLDQRLILLGLSMGLATFPGTWIASRFVHRMKVEEHNRLIEILITVCGIFFIYKAFGSLVF
jgi:uncharacterized membrane protein YfcA